MGRLANISGKEAVKAFEKAGWRVAGQVGNHVVMIKPGIRANLSRPPAQRTVGSDPSHSHPPRGFVGGRIPRPALTPADRGSAIWDLRLTVRSPAPSSQPPSVALTPGT